MTIATRDIFSQAIATHPAEPEALTTARGGVLARWALGDGQPILVSATQTPHARLRGIAVAPDGGTFVVGDPENRLEVRAWDDLRVLRTIALPGPGTPGDLGIEAIAWSPDGRWLAVADTDERVYLVSAATGVAKPALDAGERTYAVAFDPSARILATACSFEGGALVRLDNVTEDGELVPIAEISRSDVETEPRHFVDTIADVAFSASGRWLGLFETSAIYQRDRPPGWRGDVVAYSLATRSPRWQVSIDATVTGDTRSLWEMGYSMGFPTGVLFVDDDRVLCGSAGGTLLEFRASDGKPVQARQLPTSSSIIDLALGVDGAVWLVLDDGKVLVQPPADL